MSIMVKLGAEIEIRLKYYYIEERKSFTQELNELKKIFRLLFLSYFLIK